MSCQPVFVEPGDCEIIKIGNKTKDLIKVVEPPSIFLRIASITNSAGLIENYQYDNIGRIVKSNNLQAKTYKTYSYPTGKIEINEFDSLKVNTITSKGILNSKGLLNNFEVYYGAVLVIKKTYLYNDSMQVVKEVLLDVIANKETSTAWIYDENGNLEELKKVDGILTLSSRGYNFNEKLNMITHELNGMSYLGKKSKNEASAIGDLFDGIFQTFSYEYNSKGLVTKMISKDFFGSGESWMTFIYTQ